jgi:hypothetical protein
LRRPKGTTFQERTASNILQRRRWLSNSAPRMKDN